MIKIKVIKSRAKRLIESCIYEGQRLIERLTYETLSQLKEEHGQWSKNVVSILGGMFGDKTLANEFQSASVISFDENDSHLEEMNRLVGNLKQQVKWLESLAESVNGFPEAHNTPVVSRGR